VLSGRDWAISVAFSSTILSANSFSFFTFLFYFGLSVLSLTDYPGIPCNPANPNLLIYFQ
jgi:hypothetical protein